MESGFMSLGNSTDFSSARSMAFSDVNALKNLDQSSPEGVRAVAEQFESLFLDIVLKSMRKANDVLFEDNYLSSSETVMHQEMLDHQWAIHISENGGVGLAEMIEKQLGGRQSHTPDSNQPSLLVRQTFHSSAVAPTIPIEMPSKAIEETADKSGELMDKNSTMTDSIKMQSFGFRNSMFEEAADFVSELSPVVKRVLNGTEFSSVALLAQSALETGWGNEVIHRPEGASSYNLFGIKAGSKWAGETVSIRSIEFEAGQRVDQLDKFRVYENWESAIRDYVDEKIRGRLDSFAGDFGDGSRILAASEKENISFTESLERSLIPAVSAARAGRSILKRNMTGLKN